MAILMFIVFGFVVGLVARALMPGRQTMGVFGTLLLGVAGSFMGGLIASAITGRGVNDLTPAGVIGSVLGAMLLLAALGSLTRRGGFRT